MPWEITHLKELGVLSVRVSGDVTVSSWCRLLKESMERAQALSCCRSLVDYRDSNMKMSFVDLYNRAGLYTEAKLPHNARIALIFRDGYADAEFAEVVTQNRGYQVKAFSSLEPAIVWLTRPGGAAGVSVPMQLSGTLPEEK